MANFQPDLTAPYSINGLSFTSTDTVTLSSTGGFTLTIGDGGIDNSSASGLKTVSNTLTLAAAQSFTNSGSLTLSGLVDNGGFLLTLSGNGNSGTLTNTLSGAGGLTKSGTGTWIVSGTNSYTGPTAINDGTLSINSLANLSTNSALGAPTTAANGTIAIGAAAVGGTLVYTGGTASTNRVIKLAGTTGGATLQADGTGAITFTSAFTATGAGSKTLTLTGANANDNTISGAIVNNSGANRTSILKTGAGTWLLSGANTYTGTTTVNDGTLKLGSNASLANTAVTVNSTVAGDTALLDLNGFNATVASLTFGGSFTNSTANVSTGAGTLTLGGNVTYDNTNNPLGSTLSGLLALGAATRTFTIGDSTTAANDLTVSANISSTGGGLTKAGAGTLLLSGANSYTGPTTVNAGTLILGGAGTNTTTGDVNITAGTVQVAKTVANTAIGDSANVTVASGASLTFNGGVDETIGSLAGGGTVDNLHAASMTLTTGGNNTDFSGVLQNTGGNLSLVKTGTGNQTLSGSAANTFAGGASVNDGTLNLNKTAGVSAVGSGPVTVGDGTGTASSANLVLLASNQIADTAAVTLNADGRLALNNFSEAIETIAGTGLIDLATSGYLLVGAGGSSSTFGGSVTGTGTLEKAGAGDFTFNSSLNFSGTFILSGGTLQLNGFDLSVSTIHVTGNTVIDFGNSSASVLTATNFIIDSGFSLSVTNWSNAVDYFYSVNNPGGSQGNPPLNQITFEDFTNDDTKWLSYDQQITPVPEPSAYGAGLMGFSTLLLWWRRRRRLSSKRG